MRIIIETEAEERLTVKPGEQVITEGKGVERKVTQEAIDAGPPSENLIRSLSGAEQPQATQIEPQREPQEPTIPGVEQYGEEPVH
jgi:hypothetical protein